MATVNFGGWKAAYDSCNVREALRGRLRSVSFLGYIENAKRFHQVR